MIFGLNVTYRMKPGMRGEFLRAVHEDGLLAAIRQEEGCLKYDYYLSADDADELLLVEHWTERAAQERHTTHPNMAALGKIKAVCVQDVTLDKFDL